MVSKLTGDFACCLFTQAKQGEGVRQLLCLSVKVLGLDRPTIGGRWLGNASPASEQIGGSKSGGEKNHKRWQGDGGGAKPKAKKSGGKDFVRIKSFLKNAFPKRGRAPCSLYYPNTLYT
tara:strand:+ start:729 stop:1085 length:357 start_codon:yes stop_codon:yes gene_type:complete